jgi:hypothetical protein
MDKEREERCLRKLSPSVRRIIDGYPENARRKILEKIDYGYSVSDCTHWDVDLVMGFSHYCIERNGNEYPL